MSDIKTKDVVEGTAKAVDKFAVAAGQMKNAYIRTKQKAENSVYSGENSPEEYASDRVSGGIETVIHESVDKINKQGRKSVKTTKDNISKVKKHFKREQLIDPLKKQAEKQTENVVRHTSDTVRQSANTASRTTDSAIKTVRQGQKSIKTIDRSQKAIKQTARSTGKATIKTAKHIVKTAQRSVKNAKASIKTTEQAAKAAKRTAKNTVRTAKATARAAKAAARTAKAVVKGTITAVKAIIALTKSLITAIIAGGWVVVVIIIIICMIGLIVGSCFGIFFSSEDTGSGQTIQTVVREINNEYQTKLDTIKANISYDVLEMSGSRAVWSDVLAVYAVKVTTDPDNTQEVASMDDSKKAILKDIFWQMNVISSRTKTAKETVVTEKDDGKGKIIQTTSTVNRTTLYISVSHKTAEEMADYFNFNADQRAQLAELLADDNRSMWSAVLYGVGTGDGEIVTVALSQVGNVGGQPYWSWYGFGSRVEWCACFVSWCANECGYIDAGVIPKFSSCNAGIQWFKDRSLWQDNSYEPCPGDIIFFDWDSSSSQEGQADHVGIVEKVENGIIYTVEGNSGDSCQENNYPVGYNCILGYGTPAY